MPYKVFVDDNYDYMDESKRYAPGAYKTYDEAVDAAKKIVDEFLSSAYSCRATLIPSCSAIWWSVHDGPKENT